MRVGGLGVVDEPDAVDGLRRRRCGAGRDGRTAARPGPTTAPRRMRERARQRPARSRRSGARCSARRPGGRAASPSSAAEFCLVSTNARSASTSSTRPSIEDRRDPQGEPDRPAALDDLGLHDQLLGQRVGDVVDARDVGVLVDAALGPQVLLERAVPVQVVRRDVEAGRRDRRHRALPVQLEAGQLDGDGRRTAAGAAPPRGWASRRSRRWWPAGRPPGGSTRAC